MKNAKQLIPALAVLLCVSLSCTALKDRISNLGSAGSAKVPSPPPFDPNGRMVSPGAHILRILAESDPAVAGLVGQVEAAEQKMMKQIIEENRRERVANRTNQAFTTIPFPGTKGTAGASMLPVSTHLMFQSGEVSLPTVGDGLFLGGFTGFLKGMIATGVNEGTFNKKDSKQESVEGGTSTMNMEIGVNPDGSSVFEMGIVTETQKNGVKARSEMKSRIEGQDCPNAEGQVPITVKMRLAGQSGGTRYEQEVTAFIRLIVNDNAEIATTTIDITQATGRNRNGNYVFVESGVTLRQDSGQSELTQSNRRIVQSTDNASGADKAELDASGYSVALGAAMSAITAAESAWKGGACIRIEAKSPGSVDPGSGIEIPVKVMHKKEGSEVFAKLDAALEGESSIDPTSMPKTPGTLIYVAPGETGKTATIKLKAISRRGIATLDLTASTGTNSYRIAGGLDDWYTKTIVCDITKPFTLTGGGFTMQVSGGLSGTYSYTGPFNAKGTGTYEISFPNGRENAGEMVGRGDGTIQGGGKVYSGSGTEKYVLTTVDGPCVDGPAN